MRRREAPAVAAPGAASRNGDIDNEWVYIEDKSLKLDGGFQNAVAFASQVLDQQENFMTNYHKYCEDPGGRMKKMPKDVQICVWKLSTATNEVYDRTSTEPPATSMPNCVHVLLKNKNTYFPMIPRRWLVDAAANAASKVKVTTRDVIVRTVEDSGGESCLQVEHWDDSSSQWVLSTRMPQVALSRRRD